MTVEAGVLQLSRARFDVGLLSNRPEASLSFWRDEIGLPVERTLQPVPGVTQHKLTLHGAVLKVNCVDHPLPVGTFAGTRLLILADPTVTRPVHRRGPDGDPVWLVPPGTRGVDSFGIHQAVSDEAAFHRFYGDVLGLWEIADRTYDFAGATISFSWSPDVGPVSERGGAGYNYLTFQVMDATAAHRTLIDRGAVEERPPSSTHTTTDSTISFILDPDGNQIEISARPDLVSAAESGSST